MSFSDFGLEVVENYRQTFPVLDFRHFCPEVKVLSIISLELDRNSQKPNAIFSTSMFLAIWDSENFFPTSHLGEIKTQWAGIW